jgi:CPA2 family monovalent cation:H+ antiporter-2
MVVSESQVGHEILADLLPLRNAFVALFFVTIGALIDPKALTSNPALLGVIVAVIILGKVIIWTSVVRLFRYSLRTAVLVGVGLTQIGEFSYVFVQVARDAGLVETDVYSATLAASLPTILLNAILMRGCTRMVKPVQSYQKAAELIPKYA